MTPPTDHEIRANGREQTHLDGAPDLIAATILVDGPVTEHHDLGQPPDAVRHGVHILGRPLRPYREVWIDGRQVAWLLRVADAHVNLAAATTVTLHVLLIPPGPRPATSTVPFDPAHARTAETAEQAAQLAVAYADGTRSWTNLADQVTDTPEAWQRLAAQMDASQAEAWAAAARALAAIEHRDRP